ncbi:hypothetical protein SASPL_118117 [Salvia splendens]|uniref:Uncharacterized protein n=1 Tax=Salvia splendens TaxID=180675 RepID=A0A8X8XW53_SALSN|nr:hypothetical protein SASPL_118117 [Salvia splendens]
MESPYSYRDEQQGGCYEKCYSPNQGGSYYDPGYFDYYANESFETCADMEEQTRSKWDELLEIRITEVEENKKVTNLGELEYNMGILATTIGSKHTLGTLPSLPGINPKGKCHAVQLRSVTTYQPPQAADLGRGRKEKEQEPTGDSPADDHLQRPATHAHSGPEGYQECSVIQVVTDCVGEVEVTSHQTQDPVESCLIKSFTPTTDLSTCEANVYVMIAELEVLPERIPQKGGIVTLLAPDGTLFQAKGHRVKKCYSLDKVMEEDVTLEEPPKE